MAMEDVIFHFMDCEPLAIKSDSTSDALYKDFWSVVLKDEIYLTKQERSVLEQIKDAYNPTWINEFGSVILEKECGSTECAISFVALDVSKNFVHSALIGAPNVRNPVIVEFGLFSTPNIVRETMNQFRNKVYRQRRTQQNAFFYFMSALEKVAPGQVARFSSKDFGFDDRAVIVNTSFPLVLSAIYAMLISSLSGDKEEVFNKCASVYLLTKIQDLVDKTTSKEYCGRSMNRCVTAARELEPFLSPIENGEFKDIVRARLGFFFKKLKELAPARDKKATDLSGESVVQALHSLRSPDFPTIPSFQKDAFDVSQIKADAKRNLNWSSLSGNQISATGTIQEALVKINQLNRYFWDVACSINDFVSEEGMDEMLVRLKWLDNATGIVAYIAKSDSRMMFVLLRSYKLLAHWITYCWADRSAVENYPVYETFAPALNPTDLMHLVLDDKRALHALNCVRDYLRERRANLSSTPFTNAKDTMSLASAVASSANFKSKYEKEMIGARAFVNERKQTIASAKKKRLSLSAHLNTARKKLKGANQEQIAVKQDMKSTLEKLQECETKIGSYSLEVQRIANEYENFKIPDVVAFRLPSEEQLALQWMFFMFMPVEFQLLCNLTLSAQSQLWDQVPSLDYSEKTNLHDWFQTHRKGDSTIGEPAENLALRLWTSSGSLQLPSQASNSGYCSESRVLFPDCPSNTFIPIWVGGQDPFAQREAHQTARIFTEPLCASYDRA